MEERIGKVLLLFFHIWYLASYVNSFHPPHGPQSSIRSQFSSSAFLISSQPASRPVRTQDQCYQFQKNSYTSLSSSVSDILSNAGQWYDMNGCQVLLPTYEKIPKAIIHFIGGYLLGSVPSITYSNLLSRLADEGYLIVATAYTPLELNHDNVSRQISLSFRECYYKSLPTILGNSMDAIPVIGLSHSLGGKLSVLISSRKEDRKLLPTKAANVFLSFNNYGLQDSNRFNQGQIASQVQDLLNNAVPDNLGETIKSATMSSVNKILRNTFSKAGLSDFINESALMSRASRVVEEASDLLSSNTKSSVSALKKTVESMLQNDGKESYSEFNPSPTETFQRLVNGYNVDKNYLYKFSTDEIDQSDALQLWLSRRGCEVQLQRLNGNHLTPNQLSDNINAKKDFDNFVDDLIDELNVVSINAWGSKNFQVGQEVPDFERRRYRGQFELPAREVWDDDNM